VIEANEKSGGAGTSSAVGCTAGFASAVFSVAGLFSVSVISTN
jgi:hypothetical protein